MAASQAADRGSIPRARTMLYKEDLIDENLPTGTSADKKAAVDIDKIHRGYFSCQENADDFYNIGVKPIEKELPHKLCYVDFGGGKGLLAERVENNLKTDNHDVETIIIDANDKFLQIAEEKGLKVVQSSIENSNLSEIDLATMRAVNHYNNLEQQQKIIDKVFKSLKSGGYLISQISTGSDENCTLRSAIVNLPSLGRSGSGNYYWTTEEEYILMLEKAGFSDIKIVGYAPPCYWSPEEQWDRFNSLRTNQAVVSVDNDLISKIENDRIVFMEQSKQLIENYLKHDNKNRLDIEIKDGSYIINYKYAIISSRK